MDILKIEFKKISKEKHISEIYFNVNDDNICQFKFNNETTFKTTRWNLDELVQYFKELPVLLKNDVPFPCDVEGECAAELDNNARNYDFNTEEEFEDYYTRLNEWGYTHSWHHANSGAILADVFFRRLGDNVEISWWSDQEDEEIVFKNKYGFVLIPYAEFVSTINESIASYNDIWL